MLYGGWQKAKEGSNYLIQDHFDRTINEQNSIYSRIILHSRNYNISNYIMPEFQYDSNDESQFGNWDEVGYHERLILKAYPNETESAIGGDPLYPFGYYEDISGFSVNFQSGVWNDEVQNVEALTIVTNVAEIDALFK